MKKSNKIYKKALEKYNEGYIDKAINLCEKSISYSIENTASINLKGLLFYLKGDIENAKALWKMNAQINGDNVSKKYLEGIEKDREKFEKFLIAIKHLEKYEVKKSIELLEECKDSAFNTINVNNYLALCHIKLGEYKKAERYIEEVLAIDKLNSVALENKRLINEYNPVDKSKNYKKYLKAMVFLLLITLLIVRLYKGYSKVLTLKNSKNKIEEKQDNTENNKSIALDQKDTGNEEEKQEVNKQQFPYEAVNNYLDEGNYEELLKIYSLWDTEQLTANEKNLLGNVREKLERQGAKYFYYEGMEEYKNKNYIKAIEYFSNTEKVGKNTYLYPHAIYMNGLSYEKIGDVEKALLYLGKYAEGYEEGTYIEEALYKLAVLNKNINMNQAKEYGKRISEKFPKSQYNNSIIKEILEK